jgi:hypothetical protein
VPVCLFEVTEISPPGTSNNLGIVAGNLTGLRVAKPLVYATVPCN